MHVYSNLIFIQAMIQLKMSSKQQEAVDNVLRLCIQDHFWNKGQTLIVFPCVNARSAPISQWHWFCSTCLLECDPNINLKLYCRYLYTRPCMINHIWGLKQLWLQVNGHAWFHLQRLRWPVRNGEGAKNSKWKYMSPAGFEPTPRQSKTGKLQRLRPLGHEGLMVISG